jgi:hypothetical protein
MIPDFGVGIQAALFEISSFDLLEEIQNRIIQQIATYAGYVTILQLIIDPVDEQSINIKLKYEIDFAEIVDSLDIEISNI